MENIRGNLWGNPGGNLGCKLWKKKIFFKRVFFGDSNPGQIDDFHLLRLFCLSIYIRNITYSIKVIQRIKKNGSSSSVHLKGTACCFGEVFQLNLLTLSPVSAILYGTQSGNQTGKPVSSVWS